MGIDIPSMQFLCCAKSIGADFSDTITVGRQIVAGSPNAIASTLGAINISREQASVVVEGQFAEPLYALLGAKRVSSLDASDYESATHVHDLNLPLPSDLVNRFSVVHDGGTIEHVFNIPQAFKNCMEMVRVGGHFVQINVANNFMGHGFWQISPELIYRAFSRENGFEIRAVLLHEQKFGVNGAAKGGWYKVVDPADYRRNIALINGRPVYICTIAQRVEGREVFAHFPKQSLYAEVWNQVPRARPERSYARRAISRAIPQTVKNTIRSSRHAIKRMIAGPFDRRYYHRISADDVIRGRL
jgi:hypothetical protein